MDIIEQILHAQQTQIQSIKKANYQIEQIESVNNHSIVTGEISNNFKHIIAAENQLIKIWKYRTNFLIKTIQFDSHTKCCKFTEDSQLLYVGTYKTLHQFSVNNQFKRLSKQIIHESYINNIIFITNLLILTSSNDHSIIKTYVPLKQQLLKIQEHNFQIYGLDYNKRHNIIASGSHFNTIKLWNGNDGSLIMDKQNAYKFIKRIYQVLFIINNNQLISLDLDQNLIIWNINYQTKQREKLYLITDSGYNISLVLQQQFILSIGKKFIKVLTIKGVLIRQFQHHVTQIGFFDTIQPDSMKAILILGLYKLQLCKLIMN